MIQHVYGVDPLLCPKCGEGMKIIAFINNPDVIEKILRHLDRWDPPRGPPFEKGVNERVVVYDEFCDFPDHDDFFFDGNVCVSFSVCADRSC